MRSYPCRVLPYLPVRNLGTIIGFGGPVLKSGDPVEQIKQVKYMDLVASAIMLHNVADLTDLLSDMAAEGLPVTKELVSRLSPYMREHIRRFGQYVALWEFPG